MKPTYGRVSRYGLIALASSLDQIGPFAQDVTDTALLLTAVAGYDRRDATSIEAPVPEYVAELSKGVAGLTLGLPDEYFLDGMDPDVERAVRAAIEVLKELGARLERVSLPTTKHSLAAYYLILPAEASSNLARYDGVKFGLRVPGRDLVEMESRTRAAGFGAEVKRRIMLGTYALSAGYYDAYYGKAQSVRTLVRREFAAAFARVDLIGAPPNSQTCPVCQGMPGVLPVVNRRAVEFGIRTALAFHCRVNAACRFARKHYYYPDMPKNYQISQYEEPLAEDGFLEVDVDGVPRTIGIQRLHLEEDVGKLLHEGTMETAKASLVDFNRSGVPLMETVSRPELRSPEEAAAYLRAFRAIVVYLGVSNGNMEEGSLRCDANVSLRPRGSRELGTKVEIKNMNSFRSVKAALEFEVRRQAEALAAGERIVQETRLWDADRGLTRTMRSKEYAHDYRYFPEPDLVPLTIDHAWIEEIRAGLPELPRRRRARFVTQYGLPLYDAEVLTQSRALAEYFEAAVREFPQPKVVSNWVMSELLRELGADDEQAIRSSPVTPARLAGLLVLIEDGTISGKIAKEVFEKMRRGGEDARTIVGREGLTQVADEAALGRVIDQVLARSPKAIEDYKRGKTAAAKALVGQVMKATGGKANPGIVNRLLEEKLSKI